MICSWSVTSSYWRIRLQVLYNYHILQDLSLYLHLLIFCFCLLKNTLSSHLYFCRWLAQYTNFVHFSLLGMNLYGSMLLSPKHQVLIGIITVNTMRPLGSFWRFKTMTKEMQPRVAVISLTIPLSLIVIILIKRSIEATVVFQDAGIIAATSSINGNY